MLRARPVPAHARSRPTRPPLRVAAALAAVAVIAVGCVEGRGSIRPVGAPRAAGDGGTDVVPASSTLEWGVCDSFDIDVPEGADVVAGTADLECARLAVPLDRAEPEGRTIGMAVARLRATGPDPLGTLVVNPGGPGGSGLSMVALGPLSFPPEITERWDVVGFDPRGLGASEPVDCLDEDRRAELANEDLPDDSAAAAEVVEAAEAEMAEGCRADDAELAERMGTSWVVDDLEALRVALGDEPLHFLGLSYGTRIGAVYAQRYPEQVGAMVLDGAVSPDRALGTLPLGQATGIRRAYEAFLARCAARSDCPLGPDPATTVAALIDRLDAEPITYEGPDGEETLDGERLVTGIVTSLYDASSGAPTELALAALGGDDADRREQGAAFLGGLADRQDGRREDGRYGNAFEVQALVSCADAAGPLSRAEGDALRDRIVAAGGVLAEGSTSGGATCAALPVDRGETTIGPTPVAGRLLVIGTAGDPATPVEWADELAAALGGAPVLRYEGRGHTASLSAACVTERAVAFLADPSTPPDTTPCPDDPAASDLYLVAAEQFTAMGLPERAVPCIADALRSIDPLDLVGDGEDLDRDAIATLQQATVRCARGG